MIKVAVVGGTGYTGVEMLRLLAQHPAVSLEVITSRAEAGMPVARMFPSLRGHVDLAFSPPDIERLQGCELVFFATPNGISMTMVRPLIDARVRV
ncbi:MAG: N-acetyl-gamma-glutamyl-phosphate reductase, partial [Candidatus Saccharimonadales bacterium]